MKTKKIILILFLFIGLKSFGATKYYVSTTGSDANSGLTLSTAKRNIQSTINSSISGDTILVNNGIYFEKVFFSGKNVKLISNYFYTSNPIDIDNTIIDGNTIPLTFVAVIRYTGGEDNNSLLSGFTIRNGNRGGILMNSSTARILNCKIINNSGLNYGGISLESINNSQVILENVVISNNTASNTTFSAGALYFSNYDFTDIILKNCIINNNYGQWAIYLKNGIYSFLNCTIALNSAVNNCFYTTTGVGSTTVNILNSIIYNNLPFEFYAQNGNPSLYVNISNTLIDTTKIQMPGGLSSIINFGLGIFSGNPHFKDPNNYNFQLNNFSRCIGSGTLTNMPLKDLNNQSRPLPIGSLPDLGAIENINGFNAPILTSIQTTQGKIKLNWTHTPTTNILRYRIYRSTSPNANILIDSVANNVYIFTDSQILNNKQYYYSIVAINNQMVPSGFSNERRANALQNPLLTSPLNNSVSNPRTPILKWRKNTSATTYLVQSSLDSLFATTVFNSTITDTSITANPALLYNTNYFWRVRANDSLGISNWSSVSKFQTELSKPVLTSIQTTQGKIKLNWTHTPSTNILRYRIYRSISAGASVLIDSVAASVFTFTDSLILNNTKYYYRIVAINNQMVPSGFSNERRANALQNPLLTSPLNNSVSNPRTPILKWRKNTSATSYLVQSSLDSLFATTVFNSTIADTSITANPALLYNTNYFWRVRANDSLGISNWSSVSKFQTELSKPVLTSIHTTQGKIKLNWTHTPSNNILRYRIYRSTSAGASVLIDSIAASVFTFTDSLILNSTQYYYRIVAVNNQMVPSGFSNERRANALQNPLLTSPLNNSVSNSRTPILKWRMNPFATTYLVQASLDSLFATTILNSTLADTSVTITTALLYNTNYFWRVRANDSLGISNWSSVSNFQTELKEVQFDSLVVGNHKAHLFWSYANTNNIKYYKIYRKSDTSSNYSLIKQISIISSNNSFTDSGLINNLEYKYYVIVENFNNVNSSLSNILSGIPFNKKPICVRLNNATIPNAGRKISTLYSFTSVSSYDSDGKIDSVVWFVNNKKVSNNISINYGFRQGTNIIKLVVYDSDLDKDSSIAKLHISTFKKQFGGAIVSGLTAADNNRIYVSDDVFTSGIGSKMYQLDSLGQTSFELIVSQQLRSTPSITPDTSILITNGSLLNGFTKNGVPLFGVISLGGLTNVTPTVDSLFNRLYLGASNRKFFAINYSNGGVIEWDFTCDAAISTSAIISNDRKLIFSDLIGNIYGFDISTLTSQGINPKWKLSLNDSIVGSLAIDLNNNLYVGSKSGKIYKLRFEPNGNVTVVWSKLLSGTISTSPIIDGNGKIYVGDDGGILHKLNGLNGNTIWSYNLQSPIKSSPFISDSNIIYTASYNGLLTALDTNGYLFWYYKDTSAIVSNILHIDGTTYIGTMNGDYLAFWDKGLKTYGRSANVVRKPIWSTYQGDFRRTGYLRSNFTIVGINTIDFKKSHISVFPNPASTKLNVVINNINSIVMMEMLLMDINGKIIKRLPVKEYQDIDISDLNIGVYFIKIGPLYQKFIKY